MGWHFGLFIQFFCIIYDVTFVRAMATQPRSHQTGLSPEGKRRDFGETVTNKECSGFTPPGR